jgi:hypothetical protein
MTGCVIAIGNDDWSDEGDEWEVRQAKNNRYIRRLDLGRSMNAIQADLGEPDFNESFQRNGETFQVLYYRTRRVHDDSVTTKDETTPFVFIDRELVGWGETAIENATR